MMGLSASELILAAIFAPFVGAAAIAVLNKHPNARETATFITATALFAIVLALLPDVMNGARPSVALAQVAPGISLSFTVEPLGMLFALIASGLWIVNSLYSIGYMRAEDAPRQTGFYACFAIALGSTMAIAFAGNLFTLFLFYEVLTISTFPLVTHKRSPEAMRSGRLYLLLLLGTSMVLFLPAIIATWWLGGTIEFAPGGILNGKASPLVLAVLLGLYVFGIGKAALMPFHVWLPAAMVAPTPVSALLHAVAVVKAGVFSVVKIVVYVFGLDTLSATNASEWLLYAACFSLLAASVIALKQDNLKARLAYSTVSQLAYVVVGAALVSASSITGAGLHIAAHAVGKITLFFCAGAIYVATHKTEISQLDGIGRRMPITMGAFLIGSLSLIGLPPFGGLWSKWTLAMGALDSGHIGVVAVFMLSSLLSAAYLLPIVARAFFRPPPGEAAAELKEAPVFCLIALSLSAVLCLVLFFQADVVAHLLGGMTLTER